MIKIDFMEAVKAMKEGKKVTRPKYGNAHIGIKKLQSGTFNPVFRWLNNKDDSTNNAHIDLKKVEATDWEIYGEDEDWCFASRPIESQELVEYNKQVIRDVKKMFDLIEKDVSDNYNKYKGVSKSFKEGYFNCLSDLKISQKKRSGLHD